MMRVMICTSIGTAIGFVVFVVLFCITWDGPERWLGVVFAVMASIPVACIGTVIGTFMLIKQELGKLRREIRRLHDLEDMITELQRKPSTQFKAEAAERCSDE